MTYTIRAYSYRRARDLGVTIKPSRNRTKKLDVFDRTGKKLASIGAQGMNDYPTFMATRGKVYADKRRRLYKMRHSKDRSRRGTPGYYADKMLW